jgi:hypothetical protein
MHILREKTRAHLQAHGPPTNKDVSIPLSESIVGREMSKADYRSSGLDYELRWDLARKDLVP